MKICFCVSGFPLLSQTFVTTQVLYAVRQGHEVTVACKSYDPDLPLADDVKELLKKVRIVIWPRPIPRPFRLLPDQFIAQVEARWARRIWRQNIDADVVIAHFGFRGRAVARAQQDWDERPPLITVFHGRDVSFEDQRSKLALYHELFREGDLHLTVNQPFADLLIKRGAPTGRVQTHHLGIPTAHYTFAPSQRGPVLRLISVCRLVEKKGLRIAIEALALLRQRHPDLAFEYIIGGDGPLEEDLRAQVTAAGLDAQITFAGPLAHEDTLRQIAQADALLLPSVTASDGDQEGIPVTLMEAMALGTPVCTTRHSGIPELVTHNETGLLSDEADAATLCTNIAALAQDPDLALRLSRAARHKVEQAFNEDIQNAQLLAHCETLHAATRHNRAPEPYVQNRSAS
ncbi:MAG: glycosyltransferase [Pseudomonadota bacterium]